MAIPHKQQSMRFLAFCDYSQNVGLGHLRRCEKLFCLLDSLCDCEYSVIKNATIAYIKSLAGQSFDGIIVDSYVFTRTHYALLARFDVALLCFDDENRGVYPAGSFVLNGAPNAHLLYPQCQKQHPLHTDCAPTHCIRESKGVHYALGLPYALTSPHFTPKPTHKEQIQDIFINFGGADSLNFSAQVLECIPRHYHAHLVLGELYSHTLQPKANVTLYHNLSPNELNALIACCDVAISAGGGMLLELAQSQMPTIMFATAPNQAFQVAQFKELGAFIEAKDFAQIPALLSSLAPQCVRQNKADILAQLPLGVHLAPALKQIFKL
ncbi:hypothetical protein ACWIWK_01415 [Helicobacter sp. 23-1048]